jgi:hypothetical protein
MMQEARVVVCSGLVASKIRGLAPKGTEIIVDDRTLDKGGLEMLRKRLARLAVGEKEQGARHARR